MGREQLNRQGKRDAERERGMVRERHRVRDILEICNIAFTIMK